MKAIYYYLSPVILLAFAACNDNEQQSCTVTVRVIPPAMDTEVSFEDIKVTLTNKAQGTTYSALCSTEGVASLQVEYGEYTVAVHYQTPSGIIYSGRIESLSLLPEQVETLQPVELHLTQSPTHAIVIKEIFYAGHTLELGIRYLADQYITLYNNSDATIYLDGLCVGMVDPANSTESPWMKYTNMERIPISSFTWQFPGSGTEYPLLPGKETTIATNAVDHTSGEYNHPSAIDLSTADWAFWDAALDLQSINPGVKPLNLISNLNPMMGGYNFPATGATIIVFRMEDAENYINNPANKELRPEATNQDRRYLMIPKEWILDCVECIENPTLPSPKRVPAELDNGSIYIPEGIYSGYSVIRKKAPGQTGQTIYQDTNNSTEDMEISTPTLKK